MNTPTPPEGNLGQLITRLMAAYVRLQQEADTILAFIQLLEALADEQN